MKNFLKIIALSAVAVFVAAMFAACSGNCEEVAGTYKMVSVTGSTTTEAFSEYTMVLTAGGEITVRIVYSDDSLVTENKGTFSYDGNKIYATYGQGIRAHKETYDYLNGVITCHIKSVVLGYVIYDYTVVLELVS